MLGSKSSPDSQKRPRSREFWRESGQTFRPSTQARAGARLIQQPCSAASGGCQAGCRGEQLRASPSARLRPTIAPGIACRNPSGKPSCTLGAAVCCLSCAQPPLAGRKRLSGRRWSGNPAKSGRKSIHFGSFRDSVFRFPKHRHEASRLFQQPAVGKNRETLPPAGETRKPAGLVGAPPCIREPQDVSVFRRDSQPRAAFYPAALMAAAAILEEGMPRGSPVSSPCDDGR